MYTISDTITSQFYKCDEKKGDSDIVSVTHNEPPGLYIYDIGKLFNGWVEKYKLAKAVGGVCCHLDNSLFSDRFSFVSDYDTIIVLPFPHLNLMNMVGMGQKHEYLIWRQKNGFFTALDKHG